jgi:hypothetical protein
MHAMSDFRRPVRPGCIGRRKVAGWRQPNNPNEASHSEKTMPSTIRLRRVIAIRPDKL